MAKEARASSPTSSPRDGCPRVQDANHARYTHSWFGASEKHDKVKHHVGLWQTLSTFINHRKTWMLLHRCNLARPPGAPAQPGKPLPPLSLSYPNRARLVLYLTSGVLVDGLIRGTVITAADALVGSTQLFPHLSSSLFEESQLHKRTHTNRQDHM
ncbi:uncharacterized protein LY79DRAFT_532794 [Colletotrichum navitas]|uniref:Uncharacterized protein n=1 Tax=Colletotrichum navitas TaxID=681940 RepID=A0AAD8QF65_9PEZI|nr:uncharacterized protein LY79DRAFT_532794 [Colletotrichum navitas]KAK1600178.1 hypothetical protein LY79DRAFT_532794 [Colletotrichum navitas]